MDKPAKWKNYLLSLSFANLVYLRAWSDLFPLRVQDAFYRKSLPGLSTYLGIAGDVLVLSLLTFLIIGSAPRLPGWLKRVLLVVASVLVASALHSVAPVGFLRSKLLGIPELGLICGALAVLSIWFAPKAFGIARAIAFAATPCLAVTFAGCLIDLYFQTPLPPDPPLAQRLSGRPPTRVIWIIFDEWDQRLSFTERASGTRLPVLDHLASRSFTANRALAPLAGTPVSGMATAEAVPSLLYGRKSGAGEFESPAVKLIAFGGEAPVPMGSGEMVFARARKLGWNTAAAGWYLPYCRIFAAQLTNCYWDERFDQKSSARHDFAGAAIDETRMLFETPMLSVFGPALPNARHVGVYEALRAAALRYAADPSVGLAFLHFNIPHIPYFYDPKVGRLGHYGYSDALYNNALERLDQCVGDILAAIARAGLDSSTAVVLSSDHPERNTSQDPHVPYFVHLPGEEFGMVSNREFPTLKTADLVLAIARGEVKSPSDVAAQLTK